MKKVPPVGVKLMTMEIKSAVESEELGSYQFTGYASVFGNKDSYGDVVVKGAFLESLAMYGEKGAGIPSYWSHRMDDPEMNIGVTVEAKEDDHGLFVKVQLDKDNPKAVYVHKLIKEGRVTQMSFAYTVKESSWVETEDDYYYELRKLDLHEVSVVPVGANQETELLAVKSMLSAAKAGEQLSAEAEDLLDRAKDLIVQALNEVVKEKTDSVEVSDEEQGNGKAEEPGETQAKAEDQTEAKAHDDDPDTALAMIALATAGVNFD